MRIRHVPRERDDELLRALALRARGHTWAEVAAALGIDGPPYALQQACRQVRLADLAESGEPPALVGAAYV